MTRRAFADHFALLHLAQGRCIMLYGSNARIKLIIALFVGVCLSGLLLVSLRFSQAATSESVASFAPGYTIELVPDQMTLTGDVTTHDNCDDSTVCSWLENTLTGTIMLGVDRTSPDPANWDGGSATAEVFLPDVYSPTVLVLKLSWPDRDGKGLHSPERNRVGIITLDGRPLWGKRTTHLGTFNDYYAAEHEPILATIVLTQSITHTLSFSVRARTAWDLSQVELAAYPYPKTEIVSILVEHHNPQSKTSKKTCFVCFTPPTPFVPIRQGGSMARFRRWRMRLACRYLPGPG
jgi:hypothetical protein